MSAAPLGRGRRLVAAALAGAEAFLLEPVEAVARPAPIAVRPVIAVVGLAPRCGTTTITRALAMELAARDPAGAAVVTGTRRRAGLAIAGRAAGRLAGAVGSGLGARPQPFGRLCLVQDGEEARLADTVRHLAPLVLDTGHGEPAGVPVAVSDHVLLVASEGVEPALAAVVGASLARIGPRPAIVLNRVSPGEPDTDRWSGQAVIRVERSGGGARLVLAGRDPRGSLGPGIAGLADTCALPRSEW